MAWTVPVLGSGKGVLSASKGDKSNTCLDINVLSSFSSLISYCLGALKWWARLESSP